MYANIQDIERNTVNYTQKVVMKVVLFAASGEESNYWKQGVFLPTTPNNCFFRGNVESKTRSSEERCEESSSSPRGPHLLSQTHSLLLETNSRLKKTPEFNIHEISRF